MKILKSTFLIVLSIISLSTFSQTPKRDRSKFTVGITAGPNASSWYGETDHYSGEIYTKGGLFDDIDGITIGLTGEYKFNRKLSLKTGLLTSSIYFKRSGIINDSTPQEFRTATFKYSYYYLNIPILLRFNYFETNRIKLFVNGGFVNKFLTYQFGKIIYKDNNEEVALDKSGELVDFIDYILALNVEAGIEAKLDNGFNLALYPSFEVSVLNMYNKDYFKKSYYLLGLNLSLSYNL